MPDKPVSPLRQRMIDDMTARRFTEGTQRDYVRAVKSFTVFLGRSPDKSIFPLPMCKREKYMKSARRALIGIAVSCIVVVRAKEVPRALGLLET